MLHGSFTVVREVRAPPPRVFAAFSDLSLRRRWFRIPGKQDEAVHELDFRIGGGEVMRGSFAPAGAVEELEYRSRFLDITVDERIVFSYEFLLDGSRRWVALVSVELSPHAGGTCLRYTEQYAFLVYTRDGSAEIGERRGSTNLMLNGLAAVVAREDQG